MLNTIFDKISEVKQYAYNNCVSNFYRIKDDELLDCLKESKLAEKFKGGFSSIPNKFKITKEEIKDIKDDDHFYRILDSLKYWRVTKTPDKVIDYGVDKLEDMRESLLEELESFNKGEKCIFTDNGFKKDCLKQTVSQDRDALWKIKIKFTQKLARDDDLEMLKKILSTKLTTPDIINSCVIYGGTKCVNHILDEGYDVQKIVPNLIGFNDNVEMLKLLIKRGYNMEKHHPFRKTNFCVELARNCDLKCLKYVHEELGYPVITNEIISISGNSNTKSEEKRRQLEKDTLEYLIKHREDNSQTLMFFIINTDSVSLIKTALNNGYKIDENTIHYCLCRDDLTIFKYLYENKCFDELSPREELIREAVVYGNIRIIEYLWNQSDVINGFSNKSFIDCIAKHNKSLHKHWGAEYFGGGVTQSYQWKIDRATKYELDKLNCIKFLMKHGLKLKYHHKQIFEYAVENDFSKLFKFLLNDLKTNKANVKYKRYVVKRINHGTTCNICDYGVVITIPSFKNITIKYISSYSIPRILNYLTDKPAENIWENRIKIDRADFDKMESL